MKKTAQATRVAPITPMLIDFFAFLNSPPTTQGQFVTKKKDNPGSVRAVSIQLK
jgi:hypothetical protein